MRTPTEGDRALIKSTYGKPDPFEWDEVEKEPENPEEPAEEIPLEAATPEAVTREVDEWLRLVKEIRREIGEVSDVSKKASLMASAAVTLKTLGQMTGVGMTLTHTQILSSPRWQELKQVITLSLQPWPEAMLAVAEALSSLAGSTETTPTSRTK